MIWFSVNIKKMLVGGFFQASRFSSFPVLYQTKQIVASYLNRGKWVASILSSNSQQESNQLL